MQLADVQSEGMIHLCMDCGYKWEDEVLTDLGEMIIYQSDEGVRLDVRRPLLKGSGSISHQEAMDKALAEYRKYQVKTLTQVEEDYLDSINALGKIAKRKRRQKGEQ